MRVVEGRGEVPGPTRDEATERSSDLERSASTRLTGKRRGITDRETR